MTLNAKIADITRSNAEANFALALKLAESKDINQAIELQSQHARKQMEAFVLRPIAQKVQPGSWMISWKALWMAPPQPSRMAWR